MSLTVINLNKTQNKQINLKTIEDNEQDRGSRLFGYRFNAQKGNITCFTFTLT